MSHARVSLHTLLRAAPAWRDRVSGLASRVARTWWALLCLALLSGSWPAPATAQSLESVLRPGAVIAGHARWEDDCASCHVRFDREAQTGRCMDCHKDVARDVRDRTGFHGRQKPAAGGGTPACKTCHTDHKGRDARIVDLDPQRFDHRQTDYELKGLHAKVECKSCHVAGKKWRDAPATCQACHQADDVHKGSLGSVCADCHTEADWKKTRIDHGKTRFPLTGKHVDVACGDCHRTPVYKDAPETCIACHRADDEGAGTRTAKGTQKGHQGRFGEKCDSCHGTQGWKPSSFRHDRDTRYALRGAHREATCASCHTGTQPGSLYRDKTSTACVDCHRADDKHQGSLGTECGACHTEQRWTETARFNHDKTRYPLLDRHRPVACASCHTTPGRFQVADQRCVACHAKDDKHQPSLGTACESCHREKGWKDLTRFDHAKARFALRGAHVKAECNDCHRDQRYRETPSTCIACHRQDDKHAAQLGERCEACHSETRWTGVAYDHAKARFALTGRHQGLACKSCHETPRYRDAPRDCLSCHRADDRHERTLGPACESCHNTRAWRLWTFDHDRRTRFALDGAHRPLACKACHVAPAPAGQPIAPLGDTCVACHREDDRHEGAFGTRCDQCHVTTDWKRVRPRAGGTAKGAS